MRFYFDKTRTMSDGRAHQTIPTSRRLTTSRNGGLRLAPQRAFRVNISLPPAHHRFLEHDERRHQSPTWWRGLRKKKNFGALTTPRPISIAILCVGAVGRFRLQETATDGNVRNRGRSVKSASATPAHFMAVTKGGPRDLRAATPGNEGIPQASAAARSRTTTDAASMQPAVELARNQAWRPASCSMPARPQAARKPGKPAAGDCRYRASNSPTRVNASRRQIESNWVPAARTFRPPRQALAYCRASPTLQSTGIRRWPR